MAQDTQTPQEVKPPDGYSLVQSNGKRVSRPLKDLMLEASQRAPVTPPSGYILQAAPTPSRLEQLRQAVSNSAIGHSVEATMPKLADALNLHPTETVNSPTYEQHKEQLLAPEYATPTAIEAVNALRLPGTGKIGTQTDKDRMEGVLRGAGGLTSGSSMATMAGTAVAAGLTAGVINPASAQLLSRAVSGGFTLDMLYGLYQKNKAYKKAIDSGDISEAHKIQGEMGVDAVMAITTAHHALTEHPAITENPAREEEAHAERSEQEPSKPNEGMSAEGQNSGTVPSVGDGQGTVAAASAGEVEKKDNTPIAPPVSEKVQTDANQFKAALTVPTPDENGIATPSMNVDVLFPPPKEMEGAWREASENPLLHDQFKRTGISGFSIEEPYKFGLSEQGNIDPKTGKIAINAAASNPTHTLAHEVAHDIYRRLTPENRATIDGYVKSAAHIYPEHAGGLEERVMDHFADEIAHPMSASAPLSIRKIFFESPLEPRPAASPAKAEVTPPEPKRPIYGTWSDVAKNGGSLRMGDDIRGLVTKDGDFPLVLKDTFGARHVMPASVAADVLDSPAHNYVDQVFMAKDHIYDDSTPKLEEDLSKARKMLAANKFMGTKFVDGKMVQEATGPTLTDSYRKELQDQIAKGEKILADRKAGVLHRPVPVVPMNTLRTQSSGARMLTDAIKTFGNRDKLAQEYKAPELPAEIEKSPVHDEEEPDFDSMSEEEFQAYGKNKRDERDRRKAAGESYSDQSWNDSKAPVKQHEADGIIYQSKDTGGGIEIRAFRDGKKIGEIDLGGEQDPKEAFTGVLIPESERGKGVARKMYEQIPAIAKSYGIERVVGEGVQTEGGIGIWKSLKRDGLAKPVEAFGQTRLGMTTEDAPDIHKTGSKSIYATSEPKPPNDNNAEDGTSGDPIPPTEPENPSGGQDSNTATLEPNTSEKEGAEQSPELTGKGATGNTPIVDNSDKHQLTHVDRKDAPAEVKAWDADQANKWLGKSPALTIVSQQDEELDPKTLKTTQPWAGQFKLKQFEGMDAGTAPPIQVVRTEDGDYIVDGVHRATRAAKDGTKVRATVYSVKLPDANRTVNIPVAGGTVVKSAPVQRPVVAPVAVRVLPLSEVRTMAAALNPNPQREVRNVRELMLEASRRNPTRMVP